MCRGCNELFICEVCAVDGEHKYHDVLNLRPLVVDIMKHFEDNFHIFQHQFSNVKASRVDEYQF
jgi:hypothetical protein